MKHKVYGKHLGRDKNTRSALFKSLVGALIVQGSIVTTETKAKAIKGLVDKIITQAKSRNTQRLVSQFLTQKSVQDKLFKEVVPAVKDRSSGYTSVIKLGNRSGDNAMQVRMSLLLNQSSVLSSQLSEKSKPVVSKSVTEKQTTGKPKSEIRKQKTDNRKNVRSKK